MSILYCCPAPTKNDLEIAESHFILDPYCQGECVEGKSEIKAECIGNLVKIVAPFAMGGWDGVWGRGVQSRYGIIPQTGEFSFNTT